MIAAFLGGMELTTNTSAPIASQPRAVKIIAKSVYRELKSAGFESSDVVRFTNELLDQVTHEYRNEEKRQS